MSNISRIAVIYNTLKPQKHLDKFLNLVQKRAPSVEIDVVPTTNLQSGLAQAATAHTQGYDLMIAAGGDGTLMSVVNAVAPGHTGPWGQLDQSRSGTMPFRSGSRARMYVRVRPLPDIQRHGQVVKADIQRCA